MKLTQHDKDMLKEWDVFFERGMRVTAQVNVSQAEIMKERERLEKDPLEWIKFFFPDYAMYEFAPFHRQVIRRCTQRGEWFEVLSWARSLAKSTTVMFIVMFLALTGKKKNVILASATQDSALRLLEPYKKAFEENPLIRAYYGTQVTPGSWAADEFVAKCGCAFRGVGAGNAPRGSRNGAIRPDVILVDDFDDDEEVRNPDSVQKRWEWWEKALYPTRDPAIPLLTIFCGNIIARDCCVVRAGHMADHWDVVNIRDKNGMSTWPEKNTEAKIEEMLAKFRFLVIYGDPAPGENRTKNSSTKSCMLMGMLGAKLYIIKARLDRGLNADFIDWYVQLLEYVGGKVPVYCYMENNKLQDPFFQQVFKPLVAKVRSERHIQLFIQPDEQRKTDKATRIEANLEPLNREGNMILNEAEKDDPHMKRLDDQFKLFTLRLKFPADGPDCVEGGLRILKRKVQQLEPVVTLRPTRNRNHNRL
jgi:hypothetical protein